MKLNHKLWYSSCVLAAILSSHAAQAHIVLPSVFSDNMVLQQKTNAAIWGKSEPGKTVQISASWGKKSYTTKADAQGNWKVMLTTPTFGGPYTIDLSDGEKISLKNVLIGEVWLCSGQSNMEMPLAGWGKIKDYQKEIADAKYPNIRLLQAEHVTSNHPLDDAKVTAGNWQPCSPETVAGFSSVAYFFAREVYQKTGIPIGLIHTSWGGTIAEAWTSAGTLKQMPDFAEAVKKIEAADQTQGGSNYKEEVETWQRTVLEKDSGFQQGKALWALPGYDASSWKNMNLPGLWEDQGMPDFDGVVWFRKKITIPASWTTQAINLNLGTIDDNDIVYLDGEKIGESEGYTTLRNYTIPAGMVKAGEHILTVRVFDLSGGGGIYGDKNVLSLRGTTGEPISLDGEWQYHIGLNLKSIKAYPETNNGPNRVTVLYNAMIHPYIQYAIKGVIWYQGESNADRAAQYRQLFPALIGDWRKLWNRGDFPFYFVQLANYMKTTPQPVASAWAELRDAQYKTLSVPNTWMSVTIDIGEGGDIHPKNKQEVGRRLALIALAKTYGQKNAYSGPVVESYQAKGSDINIKFKFAEGGLKTKDGGEPKGFAVAGADQQYHWAKAVIKGNEVIVSSTEVTAPVYVRYAWANNPVCNLYNGADLPAVPFQLALKDRGAK